MPLTVNTNTLSLNAQRNLTHNTNLLAKSMERLSSGYRINRAGDDAAGLQLSEGLRSQIRGSKKALDNVLDGINILNIADGALQTIQDNLQRVRELVVQAANDTYSQQQRNAITVELQQLLADNDRIADSTTFNGVNLLNDAVPVSFANGGPGFMLQVGANGFAGGPPADTNVIDIADALIDFTSDGVNVYGTAIGNIFDPVTGLMITSGAGAGNADEFIENNQEAQDLLDEIDTAMTELNVRRGNLGAVVSRLESAANNLSISIENLSSSESRIRNVDVASESALLTQNQILQQSAAIVLSQANQTPALALQLLQGGQ